MGGAVNKYKYCDTADMNEIAMYIQNSTRNAWASHGPQDGVPYFCEQASIFAKFKITVGKKSASVGCVSDPRRAEGLRMKRAVIAVTAASVTTRSNMKTIFPMVVKPVNR